MGAVDNRVAPRQHILKSETISFDRASGIDCTVRNVSETGALLEIASPVGILNDFVFCWFLKTT